MIDEFLLQLTHDNEIFDEQWPDTYDRIKELSVPDASKLVLNSLVNYILTEPEDPSPCSTKYLLVTRIIDGFINDNIDELINAFLRVLDLARTDQWLLHFLETIYEKYQIGEQLISKFDIIEKILKILEKKSLKFNDEEDQNKWLRFLTEDLFSRSNDKSNSLNQKIVVGNMKKYFQEFYQHAIQQSKQSSIWLRIMDTLQQSSPDICVDEEPLLSNFKHLVLENNYDKAGSTISQLDLSSINLESLVNLIINLCSIVNNHDLFCSDTLVRLITKLEHLTVDKKLNDLFFNLILSILRLNTIDAPDLVYRLLKKPNFYSWQNLNNNLNELIQICLTYDQISDENYFSNLNKLDDIIEFLSTRIKISDDTQRLSIEKIIQWANKDFQGSQHVYRMGKSLFNIINIQLINDNDCMKFIDALQNRINCNDDDDDNEEFKDKTRALFPDMSRSLGLYIEHLKNLSIDTHLKLSNLFLSLLNYPFYDENQNLTLVHIILANVLFKTISNIYQENHIRLYEQFFNEMYNKGKNDNIKILLEWWATVWRVIAIKFENLVCDHIPQFLEYIFNSKDMSLISILATPCIQHTELFINQFDELVNILFSNHGEYLSSLTIFFTTIVQKYPEIVLLKHIDRIFSSIELTIPHNTFLSMIIHSLSSVANYQPDLFNNYQTKLIDLITKKQDLLIYECLKIYIVSSILIHKNAKEINEYLDLLLNIKTSSNDIDKQIIYTCLLIGLKYKEILLQRRDDFLKFKSSNLLINFLDNTIITSKIDQSIHRRAEEELELIEEKLSNQQNKIPIWIYQITKLLNQRMDNNWHILAKYFGFSSNEIKYWSIQKDPALSLINEWFLTHTLDDAIYSLDKALIDINRKDLEEIIQQNVRINPEKILIINPKRLPPIFLSYHSTKQLFIDKLKDHLDQTGYSSILYNEQTDINILDTSIRGAKVIICCINTSYIQSENCLKQFYLSLNMKKPLIFLYTDGEETWPPEGVLKSILQNYLPIQFTNDWLENKFLELLLQIRYYISPDSGLINEQYHHWFVPRYDHLIFIKSSNESKDYMNIPLVVFQPQIVISYQWDYQQDVLKLYKQLTQLGYRIWLDLFQMSGSGESLLEKLKMAIHQSFCLIICITPKYMKSMNGKHDLLLAKELNKPIIPLLLEETSTWPLNGLKLSGFAGKSYIDFRNSYENDRWTGKQYEILLGQLKKLIPNVQTDKPRHLIEMQRPTSASPNNHEQQPKRISSAPIIPQSRACSLM